MLEKFLYRFKRLLLACAMFTSHFDYLYVEPSTYCTLACERCPRTYAKTNYKLTHLCEKMYARVISDSLFNNLKQIEFGGNYGDPIMHPKFENLIESSKRLRTQAALTIHTSGQRHPAWWSQLVQSLDAKDTVLFSIDGLEDTNHLYRQGARWDWLERAIDICSGKTNTIWKFIIFQHNQHQIIESIKYAKEKGLQYFLLTKSHAFYGKWANDNVDPLAPDKKWVGGTAKEKNKTFSPLCQTSSRHYLSAEGFYSPCCWMDFNKEFSLNLKEKANDSFSDIMKAQDLQDLKMKWSSANAPGTCREKCSLISNSTSRTSHSQITLDLRRSLLDIEQQVIEFENC